MSWSGRLRLGSGWAHYRGPAGDTDLHAHHAIQIAVGQGEPVVLGLSEGQTLRGEAILVAPDVPHRLQGGGQLLSLLFVEPESALGRRILALQPGHGVRILEGIQVQRLREGLSGLGEAAAEAGLPDLVGSLVSGQALPPGALDKRVQRTVGWLRETGGIGTLAGAARAQGLSSSRLGHLFSAQVGLPFRPFALWLRLQGALGLLIRGANLTEAAHGSGFADSAHLTRTFRRMFGITPSSLARSVRFEVGE